MPQTSKERAARWPGMEGEASSYLEDHGYKLTYAFKWKLPKKGHTPTEKESDAIWYLIEEWDFGGTVEQIEQMGL